MYLKLGNTSIKYKNNREENFIILGQIVHSTMGYESPVLVHTVDELDIWFGQRFEERDWLIDLLKFSSDISLLLSSQLSSESSEIGGGEYIDYNSFPIDSNPYYSTLMFPEKGEKNTIYRLLLSSSGGNYEDYIWTGEFYISVLDLPQNQNLDTSISFLSRDTLKIGKALENGESWVWSHPKYKKEIEKNEFELKWEEINLKNIEAEEESLVFNLQLPDESTYLSSNYIVLGNTIYWTGNGSIPPINSRYFSEEVHVDNNKNLLDIFKKDGWIIRENGDNVILINTKGIQVTYFFSWPTLSLTPCFEETQKILTNSISREQNIYFWSRSIGRPQETEWEEDNIHLKIEKVTDNGDIKWRITTWRYNYLEVFEGVLDQSPNRLDYIIESRSKLIHAEIPESITLKELPEGEWQLRGGEILKSSPSISNDLRNTIKWLIRDDRQYFPDFFMIPNLEEWMNETNSSQVYQELLSISTINSFQFLIQNIGENYKWNYTKDKENKLVWFYNPIYVNREERPGYYLFLTGLIQGIYSTTAKNILYNLPVTNPYLDENPIEKSLMEHKSNYLVCNNQIYYYKEYQNGEIYDTTILMRFVMWKITRELYKNIEGYLSSQIVGEIIEAIQNTINRVKSRFNIIRNIIIDDYIVSFTDQKINLTLNTTISDLKSNNMILDIDINYNKS